MKKKIKKKKVKIKGNKVKKFIVCPKLVPGSSHFDPNFILFIYIQRSKMVSRHFVAYISKNLTGVVGTPLCILSFYVLKMCVYIYELFLHPVGRV